VLGSARAWLGAATVLVVLTGGGVWLLWPDAGDERLRGYVSQRPPVPIVFTSRSGLASLAAAAPEGEGFVFPGQALWQAKEGRLWLLTTRGTVRELTWNKPLPDGTLIDVMSPSVSPDGQTIVFAGRKGPPDPGHFRLYEVRVDGSGLRQLTGGPTDSGCTALPPMRSRGPDDHSLLSEQERRTVDYDDVDPIVRGVDGRVIFASSRTPDLGRGHSRRSTNLWIMNADGSGMRPLTANRNNDRWPFLLATGYLTFSLWSYNPEVITADERDIRPFEPGLASATRPVDRWLAGLRQPDGDRFGSLLKTPGPVWRPRPLFNGRLIFMTSRDDSSLADSDLGLHPLRVVQAEPGLLSNAPSAVPSDQPLPRQKTQNLWPGPAADKEGRAMSFATPSPCPPHSVVLAGAPREPGDGGIFPASYGIYLMDDNWQTEKGQPVSAGQVNLRLLFDDPDLVDAEPVAVYRRWVRGAESPSGHKFRPAISEKIALANGTPYFGPAGQVFNSDLYVNMHKDLASQQTDLGEGPIFDGPPKGSIDHIRIWASRRDRFDDPTTSRLPGSWELLVKTPTHDRGFGTWLPADVPTVLAAFTREGSVLRWTTAAKDSKGQRATFYGYAGDHYSGMPPGGQTFCTGCHPGHSGVGRGDHDYAERSR